MAWVVREAFNSPLSPSWSEHIDAQGRVYFFNQVTNESTWLHPMDEVYKELIQIVRNLRQEVPLTSPEHRIQAVRSHLVEVHNRAVKQLALWSGPYKSELGPSYYYNETLQVSTWVSPIEDWETEIGIRHSVLHRCLLAGHDDVPQPGRPADDLVVMPALQLPLGLARRDEDAESSARSFYTARESSRSACSARSLGGGSEASPSHKPRTKQPARVDAVQEEQSDRGTVAKTLAGPEKCQQPDQSEASSLAPAAAEKGPGLNDQTLASEKAASKKEDIVDTEDFDVTFGCSSAVQMPKLSGKVVSDDAEQLDSAMCEEKVTADDKAADGASNSELPGAATSETKEELPKADEGCGEGFAEEFDITFGCSHPAKMPSLPGKVHSAELPASETLETVSHAEPQGATPAEKTAQEEAEAAKAAEAKADVPTDSLQNASGKAKKAGSRNKKAKDSSRSPRTTPRSK
eukprot:TRINITY_DN25793_c0_g1_i1.p1 TRINITY_DN25793_c0_g1~~TRINITY_DN25793_c0_g1_i1.p1  ORF type:complete len:542 (-),score=123.66 TRINITY_DN25793_c0_g1_i1:21-1406(-)